MKKFKQLHAISGKQESYIKDTCKILKEYSKKHKKNSLEQRILKIYLDKLETILENDSYEEQDREWLNDIKNVRKSIETDMGKYNKSIKDALNTN